VSSGRALLEEPLMFQHLAQDHIEHPLVPRMGHRFDPRTPLVDKRPIGGGVVGHQFGKGNGKKAMTVLGVVGGAVAGHQIEKANSAKVVGYRVQVQLDNGETRTFESAQLDGLRVGDRVRVQQGQLQRV